MGTPRRRFLQAAAAGALTSCTARRGPWRFFTQDEMKLVAAITDCLIPPNEFPGAAEAGVPVFLDRQLAGHYRKYQTLYRHGLRALDETARASCQAGFVDLEEARRVELLRAVEQGKPPGGAWSGIDPKQFFATVLTHTMQGFYGDPRHGGNRNQVAYRMLGVPASNVRGRSQHDLRVLPTRHGSRT